MGKLIDKWGNANIGVITSLSGVTVVDVDGDERLTRDIVSRIGDTPLVTRTPSGGRHLWYKSNGEKNANLRGIGLPVDVKGSGAGIIIVPPSFRPSTGVLYAFERGSWDDLARLPGARLAGLIPDNSRFGPLSAAKGTRNDKLFRFALREARNCDDSLALQDALMLANSGLDEPLPPQEVERIAFSAWKYQATGKNWVGGEARAIIPRRAMSALMEAKNGPDALALLVTLQHEHGARAAHGEVFAIAPHAMASSRVLGCWSASRIRNARDTLLDRGFISRVHRGGRGPHDPAQYRFGAKGNDSFPNITGTPSPPASSPPLDRLGGRYG
jgi:Bifunctional DNA primase/polymerase, N-terminal/Primase C terminal 1 (PriCT-1)